MTNREAFEAWARAHHQNAEFLLPDTDVIRTLPVAWAVWQAAIAHAQQERKPRLTEEEVGLLVTDFVRQEGWPLHGLVRRVETYLSERKPEVQATGADFAYIGPPLD